MGRKYKNFEDVGRPALQIEGNEHLTNDILNEKDVAAIIRKAATYFAW